MYALSKTSARCSREKTLRPLTAFAKLSEEVAQTRRERRRAIIVDKLNKSCNYLFSRTRHEVKVGNNSTGHVCMAQWAYICNVFLLSF